MKKRKKSDPVVSEIERALDLGQFISYNRSWEFVRELEATKKSKYYRHALEHFRKAEKLYKKAGHEQVWVSLVDRVRKDHSRKYSFIGDFEKIVEGRVPESPETFEKRVRKRWVKQTSD